MYNELPVADGVTHIAGYNDVRPTQKHQQLATMLTLPEDQGLKLLLGVHNQLSRQMEAGAFFDDASGRRELKLDKDLVQEYQGLNGRLLQALATT